MLPHNRHAPGLDNAGLVDKLARRWRLFQADDPRELERINRYLISRSKGA